jgi:hypothetical protein
MSALASSLPSERRLAANRANAKLSTGPASPEGKAKSALNAVKTGLTGRTVLLPSEDADAYETHLLQYLEEFAPIGARETELVQSLADTQWRLHRIPSLESGIYALGRMRYAELFSPSETYLLDAYILQQDAKHFGNLHRQESRLRRYYQQDLKELKELQAERKKAEEEQQEQARKKIAAPKTLTASVGFEFANSPATDLNPQSGKQTAPSNPASVPLQTVMG